MLWAAPNLLMIGLLTAAPGGSGPATPIPVCLGSWAYVEPYVLNRAKFISSRMFAGAGVALDWRSPGSSVCRANDGRAIVIEFSADSLPDSHPGAMGYTQPYEGVHVMVLIDRVQRCAQNPNTIASILAHVVVHEMTHLIEGISRHSATGIMKAHWGVEDLTTMAIEPLPFAPEDLSLIQTGLRRWNQLDGDSIAAEKNRSRDVSPSSAFRLSK